MKTQDYLVIAGLLGLAYVLVVGKKKEQNVIGSKEWLDEMAKTVTTGDPKAGTGYYLLRDEYRG